jgi:hypothetical protein
MFSKQNISLLMSVPSTVSSSVQVIYAKAKVIFLINILPWLQRSGPKCWFLNLLRTKPERGVTWRLYSVEMQVLEMDGKHQKRSQTLNLNLIFTTQLIR